MLGSIVTDANIFTGFSLNTSQLECSDIIHNATLWDGNAELRCQLVNATQSCFFNDGHIEYIYGMYCTFQAAVPLGVTLMFLWLIMMLIGLATTADAFFGPCLIVMADTMHLSQNVAGVTLLALGNGAPDIFSAISSITTLKDGDAGLAFGALLGAGMFVTSVTACAIAIVKPFTAMTRPLLKDIVFYMFTIFWAFIIMFKQEITLLDSIGFIVLYVLYVLMTVLSRMFYSRGVGAGTKQKQQQEGQQEEQQSEADTENSGLDRKSLDNSVPLETIRRLRTDTDIRTNLTDVYADNLGFTAPASPSGSASPTLTPSASASTFASASASASASAPAARYDQQQRRSDAEAGYDTSLDFPGGLRRIGDAEAGDVSQEVKKPRSRRFQELVIHSSPKSSVTRKSSSRRTSHHMDDHMKRVSRVQKISRAHSHQGSPKASVAGVSDENIVSGGRKRSEVVRKISTTSFTGVERRANYLTRWMLVYGNLENVEHRSRTVSQSSSHTHDGAAGSSGGGGGGGSVVAAPSRVRSSSTTRSPSGSFLAQQLQVLQQRKISESGMATGGSGRYKMSGGLSMDGASAYFERKEQEQQSRKQQQQMQKAVQQRLQAELQKEEEDIHMRHLYRIESVDEALDDATVDHLNRLNQQRMVAEKQWERQEVEKARDKELQQRKQQPQQQQSEQQAPQQPKQDEAQGEETTDDEDVNQSPIKEFLYSLVPVDIEEFPEMTWYNKVYEIIKAPLLFLLLLSTPCVDYDQPLNGWSRILNSVHCAVAPVFIGIAFKGYQWAIPLPNGAGLPVLPIIFVVGLVLGLIVYCTSSDFEPPRYHSAFAFIGFLTAIVWIYTFANEVVNILESIGVIFSISSTILGLTVLAWANSIGDVISNTVLARQNFPRVAISACFGGPLFNLLLGVGIPFTIKLLGSESRTMEIQVTVVQLVLVVSVTISLIMSMVYLTVFRYKVGRVYGAMLVVLYVVFLIVALLAETGQLPRLRG